MIKLLKKYQIQTTPFNATNDWELSNDNNPDVLLFESTGSDDGTPFALEYIEYGDGSGYPTSSLGGCEIALEQQPDDLAISEQGLNVQGLFYPNLDPTNVDGTYKRSIYHQVQTMFYNTFRNPVELWGAEVFDFDLSQTKRTISDQFQLLDIPKNVFGDKIVPNSVIIYDNNFDNPYIITDDGNCNLFAGTNLFSKQQELGEYTNSFDATQTSSYCNGYFSTMVPDAPFLSLGLINFYTSSLSWSMDPSSFRWTGFAMERSTDDVNFTPLFSFGPTTFFITDSSITPGITYYYRIYAFNNNGNSPYSNIVYNAEAIDSFDEYSIGQTGNFNSGSGWSGSWFDDAVNRMAASESFDEYSIGQTSNFNSGSGLSGSWVIM